MESDDENDHHDEDYDDHDDDGDDEEGEWVGFQYRFEYDSRNHTQSGQLTPGGCLALALICC